MISDIDEKKNMIIVSAFLLFLAFNICMLEFYVVLKSIFRILPFSIVITTRVAIELK